MVDQVASPPIGIIGRWGRSQLSTRYSITAGLAFANSGIELKTIYSASVSYIQAGLRASVRLSHPVL